MSWRQRPTTPLLEPLDGPILVELGNWLADSLEVTQLSKQQVLLLSTLIERLAKALWREFADDLRILVLRNIAQLDAEAAADGEDTDPSEDIDD